MNNNKTSKKNSFVIEWPTSHFTIDDIQGKYPDAVNITLRFRVKQAVENKDVMVIGKIKPAIGVQDLYSLAQILAKNCLKQPKLRELFLPPSR